MKQVIVTFRAPRELVEELDRRARAKGVPRSHLIRNALLNYLSRERGE